MIGNIDDMNRGILLVRSKESSLTVGLLHQMESRMRQGQITVDDIISLLKGKNIKNAENIASSIKETFQAITKNDKKADKLLWEEKEILFPLVQELLKKYPYEYIAGSAAENPIFVPKEAPQINIAGTQKMVGNYLDKTG